MPNPYNIEQVDIPGIYGAVSNLRSSRIQQMLGERQIQAADRQAERENVFNGNIARLFVPAPTPASSGASGASSAPAPVNPVVAAYGGVPPGPGQPAVTPPGIAGADPAGTPTPQPMRMDPAVAQQLIASGHGEIVQQLNQLNTQQLEQAHARLASLAPIYATAAHIPYGTDGAQRRAYIQSILPQLQQMGIDPNEASNFDPTDQNLNAHMALGMTMDQAIASARGHPMNVTQGGSVIDTDNIDPITGQPRVLYESPTITEGGVTYTRPPSMRQIPPHPLTDDDIRHHDQGGAGQPQASGTFP